TVEAKDYNHVPGTVHKGDILHFETASDQKIVWGRDGFLFLGSERTANPEGDVDPNTLLRSAIPTAAPPMNDQKVGALIGDIEYPNCPVVDFDCHSEPFYVGPKNGSDGNDVVMPATGTLRLYVNDGYLANNSGHFYTVITDVSVKEP